MPFKNVVVKRPGRLTDISKSKCSGKLVPALVFVFALCAQTFAQSVTTTDTLGRGEIYIEANFWTATQSHRKGGEQVYGGRFSYGVGKGVEVGVNASSSDPFDADFPPEIQPGVKWKFYADKKRGFTASAGATAFLPVARLKDTDAFVMIYANLSKTIKPLKEARITIGAYRLLARNADFGTREGMNFTYEQPLTPKLSFSAQWTSGKNRFGYLTPGLSIALSKTSSLFLGYSIGNYLYDNHGPLVAYGFSR